MRKCGYETHKADTGGIGNMVTTVSIVTTVLRILWIW